MKKNFLGALFLSAIMILAGCNNSVTTADGNSANNNAAKTTTDVNYNLCKMTAETQIMRTAQYDDKWNGAEITDHYYWYNPMIEDEPAYIEFKVTKDGKDAGYVMVSTTEQDFEVPEYSTEGKTMYECLQAQSGTQDITATRFNSFDYMAEVTTGRGESKRVFFGDIAYMNNSEGGRGGSDYDEYLAQYKAFREKIGGIGGSKVELENYYKTVAEIKSTTLGRGDPKPPYSATISTSIANKNLLPKYSQHWRNDKSALAGCGPVAATMLLAYWYQHHDKTNLFPNEPASGYDFTNIDWYINDSVYSNEKDVIETLASSNYMNITYSGGLGNATKYYVWHGLYKYIWDRGYNHWVIRHYWIDANEYTCEKPNITLEWNTIYKEIQEDRPALLLYYDKEEDGGHVAVIYSVTLYRDQWFGTVYNAYADINTGLFDTTTKQVCTASYLFNEVITCKIWNR